MKPVIEGQYFIPIHDSENKLESTGKYIENLLHIMRKQILESEIRFEELIWHVTKLKSKLIPCKIMDVKLGISSVGEKKRT